MAYLLFVISMSTILMVPLAYLDPVTGSFIVQAVIGFLLGGWYLIKRYYRRIQTFLKRQFTTDSDYEQ